MTVSGGRRGGCDEDQDLVGGAISRDIVGCWCSLLAPERKGATDCSANLRPIGEKRARREDNPGTIGSNTASAGAHAATSIDGGNSTVRAADTASAGAHTDASAAGLGPAARATDRSISSTDGSDTIIPLTDTNAG